MDNVIDLNHFRNKKEIVQKYFSSDKPDDAHQKLKEKFFDITKQIGEEWQKHVIDDTLNQFLVSHFSDRLIDRTLKYTEDLNALSKLEQHIHLCPMILGPGSTTGNSIGWGAGFYLNGLLITTPEFSSEIYARCFNIILFIRMKNKKKYIKE